MGITRWPFFSAADGMERPSLPDVFARARKLDRAAASALLRAADQDLPDLLQAASEVRARSKGDTISYSRKVFIPLTNLCRDYCRYCTFRKDPGEPGARTMTPEQVLEVARAGERAGCREALFSLGDKPELLFPEMREELRRLGYRSTLHYLEAMCELILSETTLLPHANPGLMSAEWIERLARFCPSLGLMLESTGDELLRSGGAHDNAPDKVPAKRLQVVEDAGKQAVPFTTGLLIGIGESVEDRVDTLIAIRKLHDKYGHIQEVIIQNFRAKADIPMRDRPEPSLGEMLRTLAVARLVLSDMNVQAPPNLSSPDYPELLQAGINDWGGISPVTPDFINPEAPWPHLHELQQKTEAAGFRLRHRLTVYPEFASRGVDRGGLLGRRLGQAMDQEGYARGAAA